MRVLIVDNEPVFPPTHRDADPESEILTVVNVIAAELECVAVAGPTSTETGGSAKRWCVTALSESGG
jgi:hypothetical protein